MNIYFVLIPKKKGGLSVGPLLDRIAKEYDEHVPEGFVKTPEKGRFDCHEDIYYISYKRKGVVGSGVGKTDNSSHYIITSGNIGAERFEENIKPCQGKLELNNKPGGMYSVVAVDKNFGKVSAWSSQPAAEAIYYAENDQFVSISSRPLLCALSLSGKEKISLSRDYVKEYLSLGYSACGASPFVGVNTNLPEDMLSVVNGGVYFSSLPRSPRYDFSDMDEGEINECVSGALLKSFDTLSTLPGKPVFHLSGGKDSRTLFAAFSCLNIQPHAITYGRPNGDEPRIANSLANISNMPHTVLLRDVVNEDFRVATNDTLRKCEGLMPSAPSQVIYSKDDAACQEVNQARVLGQHELQRGGWAKLMHNTSDHVRNVLNKQVSRFVTDEASGLYFDRIDKIRSKRDFKSHVESLYWFCSDFRSSCYLTSSLIDFSRRNIPVFPMLDERFVDACSAVAEKNVAMLVSESTVFDVIKRFNSDSLKIPLHEDSWRFEIKKENPNLSGENYTYRVIHIEQHPFVPKVAKCSWVPGSGGSGINAQSRSSIAHIVSEIKEFIGESGIFEGVVRPEVLNVIRSMYSGDRSEFLDILRKDRKLRNEEVDFKKFLWRMYCVTVWSEGEWLHG